MPAPAFRIFVSSTFADLDREREALRTTVFPRLRALSRRHGVQFLAVDLRWGVSQEAAVDQRTVAICLEEVNRCLQTGSPMVVLLGDRYGWRPLPDPLPAAVFEELRRRIAPPASRELARWYQRDTNARAQLAATPDEDLLEALAELESGGRPRVVVCGDYSAGKSSFIKRMLVASGRSVPDSLTVSGAPETASPEEYPLDGLTLVDTPGFQAGTSEKPDAAMRSLADAAAVVYLFNPNLVTGSAISLEGVLRGDAARGLPSTLARTLFVINRADELGPDPHDSPAAFVRLCESKRRELLRALRSHDIELAEDSAPIFCLASDPYGLVGNRRDVSSADYEPWRDWDGFGVFIESLERARPALVEGGIDASILDGGIGRLGERIANLEQDEARTRLRLEELAALRAHVLEGIALARNLATDVHQRVERIVSDHVEGLLAEALDERVEERRAALAERIAEWMDDPELKLEIERWATRASEDISDWQRQIGESVDGRLGSAAFRAAFPRLEEAVDVSFLRQRSSARSARGLVKPVSLVLEEVKPETLVRVAEKAGMKLTTASAARAAKLAKGAAAASLVVDAVLLYRALEKESERDRERPEQIRAVRAQVADYCATLANGTGNEPGPVRILDSQRTGVEDFLARIDDRAVALERELERCTARQRTCKALVEDARGRLRSDSREEAP